MAMLNLTKQKTITSNIIPYIQKLKTQMEFRKETWNKLPLAKKKKWITSDKDPIMSLAWSVYKYLKNNFFDAEVDDDL